MRRWCRGDARQRRQSVRGGRIPFYVGCYYNDPATIAAAQDVAGEQIRIVVGNVPGPTSKADCLNRLWTQMLCDEQDGIM